uniref:Uncharacterized protein n=1 Tax=Skeletonema marinoi TaxID=267567 RepID=A0A7S2LF52_9STRA|mmetsp:Transcript_24542/g.41757  ORF Transcript_24542/g.41757 Transcript_24542/m.41757 type:complete len:566 (+) Transcript_24542:102-1799(+)
MAIKPSASEEDGRDVLDTVESEDIDLAALMQRYQGSLSVSMSGEDVASVSLNKVESADSDVKEDDVDYDDLDEDEYAARANDIMQRYKMQYALSDDTELSSADSSDDYDGVDEESKAEVDTAESFRECIEDRAEELVNKSRQMLESLVVDEEEEDEEDTEVVDLLENVEIGEEITESFQEDALEHVQSGAVTEEHLEEVESEPVKEDDLEHVESNAHEEEEKEHVEVAQEILVEAESGSAEEEETEHVEVSEEIPVEIESGSAEEEEEEVEDVEVDDEEIPLETETGSADLEEVEIGEEIQEDEVEASTVNIVEADAEASTCNSVVAEVEASASNSVTDVKASTSNSVAAEVEASSKDADESEDLEEMISKLEQENEVLKKKKELKKRIYELAQENDQLKMSPQRNALANMAIKFDDAVANAVSKVSKIMVCAPDDEDIFDFEGGFPQMSGEHENGVCAVGSESDNFGQLDCKQVQVLSPVSLDENTNYFPAPPTAFQLKMQAYNQKYQGPVKPEPAVTVSDVLKEARLAAGVETDDSLANAVRRVEEAKQYIRNRSVLKAQENF